MFLVKLGVNKDSYERSGKQKSSISRVEIPTHFHLSAGSPHWHEAEVRPAIAPLHSGISVSF